jgi:hypothetical protein
MCHPLPGAVCDAATTNIYPPARPARALIHERERFGFRGLTCVGQ